MKVLIAHLFVGQIAFRPLWTVIFCDVSVESWRYWEISEIFILGCIVSGNTQSNLFSPDANSDTDFMWIPAPLNNVSAKQRFDRIFLILKFSCFGAWHRAVHRWEGRLKLVAGGWFKWGKAKRRWYFFIDVQECMSGCHFDDFFNKSKLTTTDYSFLQMCRNEWMNENVKLFWLNNQFLHFFYIRK